MFEDALNLVIENKEWAFGGVGVFALGSIGALIGWFFKHRKAKAEKYPIQQLVGDRSPQINAPGAGDVTVKIGEAQTSNLAKPTIHPATAEDVEKYDPKTNELLLKLRYRYRPIPRIDDENNLKSILIRKYGRYEYRVLIISCFILITLVALLVVYSMVGWFGFF